MFFSAYQIESMLEDFQKNILSLEKSPSEKLSIAPDTFDQARQNLKNQKDLTLGNINSYNISDLVEDKTLYDPIVDNVLQSRAGRFVKPKYIPKNQPPKFPLVKKFSKESVDSLKNNNSMEEFAIDNHSENEIKNTENNLNKETIDSPNQNSLHRTNDDKLFGNIENDNFDEKFASSREIVEQIDDNNDVVFGEGTIVNSSIYKFLREYPESAIKFILRKNLDGRPLPAEYEEIYQKWETRGLSKGELKKYLLKFMQWQKFPDIPVIELIKVIRENLFDLKEKKE
tara:strand:+ start:1183 stop:2037 length:855 start_codon:yes stop_codon:yes gene_type:complete